MEHDLEKIKGVEILSFDHVELTHNKLGKNTFLDVGTLNVVFFPEFNRFVLYLDEWEYALLKRIPIVASSRTDMKSRMFNLPTYTGFYNLKFPKIQHPEALQNFETILSHYTKFSYFDEETPVRHVEASPDASFVEEEAQPEITMSQASTVSKKSTEMLVSDEAKPGKLKGSQKIKKGFAKLADKLRGSKHQANNFYLTQVLDISSLASDNAEFAPVEFFGRREVEGAIIKSKDMASKMHFGVSPNEMQFINISELKESMKMTVINEDGIEYIISRGEAEILNEIEKERKLQEFERQKQEEHRNNELAYIQKERELRELMRRGIEKTKVTQLHQTEERFQAEFDRRDDMILEQARLREAEKLALQEREQRLIAEIEQKLAELKAKERLTEEERLEFSRREKELLAIYEKRQAEKLEVEMRGKNLMKEAKARELSIQEREKRLELTKAKIRDVEKDLKMQKVGINELRNKAVHTEEERFALKKREEEMERFIALKESERIALEREAIEMESNAEMFRAELAQRELLTEAERLALIEKEKEIEAEAQRVLAELRAKENLTEAERLEIQKKEEELKRIVGIREAERLEFLKRRKDLELKAAEREAALREKERFTEAERVELEHIKDVLEKETHLREAEQEELQAKRVRLFEEAERRAAEIERRSNLTEAELLELHRKEEELQKEIEGKLANLRLKEILTEEDRKDLLEQEKTLESIKVFKQVEIRSIGGQFEKIRRQEEKLLEKNSEMIEKQKVMHHELNEMQHELA